MNSKLNPIISHSSICPSWKHSLCQLHRSVSHDRCKLTRTCERFPICDDKITENYRCVITITGIHWKHLINQVLWTFQLALYVLSFLEPRSLLRAAQTCRYWRVLAEDNLLWREKCREESIDENLVYGSNRLRRRSSSRCPWKSLYMRQHQIEQNWRTSELRGPKVCVRCSKLFSTF